MHTYTCNVHSYGHAAAHFSSWKVVRLELKLGKPLAPTILIWQLLSTSFFLGHSWIHIYIISCWPLFVKPSHRWLRDGVLNEIGHEHLPLVRFTICDHAAAIVRRKITKQKLLCPIYCAFDLLDSMELAMNDQRGIHNGKSDSETPRSYLMFFKGYRHCISTERRRNIL